MFELSKILGPLLDVRTALFTLLVAGAALLWTPWRRLGRWTVTFTVVVAALFAMTGLGPEILARLEYRFPRATLSATVDGIIVIGGDFNVELVETHGAAAAAPPRMIAATDLARRHPGSRVIFSGGSGRLIAGTKEADLAPEIFKALGLAPDRVTYEREARNTYENAVLSREFAKPQAGETWLLVTSAFHMPRAMGSFRQAGWDIRPYPVDFRTTPDHAAGVLFSFDGGLVYAAIAFREAIGLAYYRMLGYTDSWFPGP